MDIRTVHRLLKDYQEQLRSHVENGKLYVAQKRLQIDDYRCWVAEVAQRNGRIIAVRLVIAEKLYDQYGEPCVGFSLEKKGE